MTASPPARVPPDVMAASAAERLAFFGQVLVRHPKLVAVDAELAPLWPGERPSADELTHVLCYGPTGSGKSAWGQRLAASHPRRAEPDREHIPVVWFRAPLPFTWREFYIQALAAGYQAPAPTAAVRIRDDLAPARLERATEGALKRRVLAVARATETRVWIIDEIQHLGYARGPLLEHLEHLKHLADEARVMLLLTGTYDAVALLGLNGQLTRRFRPIRLDRYRDFSAESPDADSRDFVRVIQALEDRLPLPQPSRLVQVADRLHRYSLGLVGLLKPLLTRSLAGALRRGQEAIMPDGLDAVRLPDRQLTALARELATDEAKDHPGECDGLFRPAASLRPGRPPLRGRRRAGRAGPA